MRQGGGRGRAAVDRVGENSERTQASVHHLAPRSRHRVGWAVGGGPESSEI